jgi:hypothetical protein
MRSTVLRHAIWLALAACATTLAAAPPDVGGGGGEEGETATNHLAYPAVDTTGAAAAVPSFSATTDTLGVTFSYACDKPEKIDTTTFPNTSCVTADGSKYLSVAECTAAGAACEGLPVDKVYWQKVPTNVWTAATVAQTTPVRAEYIDWADNLESVTWKTTSVIRVEATPFAADIEPPLTGYQMWHVFGKGTNESWGVRATIEKLPYKYLSPFAIIYSKTARLNITKVSDANRLCDAEGSGYTGTWGGSTLGWMGDGSSKLTDEVLTPELNVGGKYTYGYNWNLRRVNTAIDKAGWWRLTFYHPTGMIDFTSFPVSDPTRYAPPDLSLYPPTPTTAIAFAAAAPAEPGEDEGGDEGGEEGGAYAPVVDTVSNITYIDICIAEGTGGGGGGGGSGEGGPPEGGGGPPEDGGGPPDDGGGGGPPEGRGGGPPAGVGGGGPPEGRGGGPPAGMGGSGDHEDGDHEP